MESRGLQASLYLVDGRWLRCPCSHLISNVPDISWRHAWQNRLFGRQSSTAQLCVSGTGSGAQLHLCDRLDHVVDPGRNCLPYSAARYVTDRRRLPDRRRVSKPTLASTDSLQPVVHLSLDIEYLGEHPPHTLSVFGLHLTHGPSFALQPSFLR